MYRNILNMMALNCFRQMVDPADISVTQMMLVMTLLHFNPLLKTLQGVINVSICC
jgi:hypothetical protein